MVRFILISTALAALAIPATAVEAPHRRAGVWESTFQDGDGNKIVDKRCTTPEWEMEVAAATAKFTAESCSKNELRRVGATWVSDSICTLFGKTITGHSVTSGDLRSQIRIDTEQRDATGTVTRTTIEGRWLGPCGPKDRPGAVVKP